jgi:hypothetical protein
MHKFLSYLNDVEQDWKLTATTKHCICIHGIDQPAMFHFFTIIWFPESVIMFEIPFHRFLWAGKVK